MKKIILSLLALTSLQIHGAVIPADIHIKGTKINLFREDSAWFRQKWDFEKISSSNEVLLENNRNIYFTDQYGTVSLDLKNGDQAWSRFGNHFIVGLDKNNILFVIEKKQSPELLGEKGG